MPSTGFDGLEANKVTLVKLQHMLEKQECKNFGLAPFMFCVIIVED
ncbi:hypothetical protein [Paenibacillus psychroresistens]|nr:hypothetical protein [Paenibacillus psychroresistens]